jgi:hypothetical protein
MTPINKFTYDDIVRINQAAPNSLRPGQRAWVVGVVLPQDRGGRPHYDQFPAGTVYTVEFENGDAIDVHEGFLEFHEDNDKIPRQN